MISFSKNKQILLKNDENLNGTSTLDILNEKIQKYENTDQKQVLNLTVNLDNT
jgi:hypothetical protein